MLNTFENEIFFKENKYNAFLSVQHSRMAWDNEATFVEYVKADSEKLETFLTELPYIARVVLFAPYLFDALEQARDDNKDSDILTAFISRGIRGMWTDVDLKSQMFNSEFFLTEPRYGVGSIAQPSINVMMSAIAYLYHAMEVLPKEVRRENFKGTLSKFNVWYLADLLNYANEEIGSRGVQMFAKPFEVIKTVANELYDRSNGEQYSYRPFNDNRRERQMGFPNQYRAYGIPRQPSPFTERYSSLHPRTRDWYFSGRPSTGYKANEPVENETIIILTNLLLRDIELGRMPTNIDEVFVKIAELGYEQSLTHSFKEYWQRLCRKTAKEKAVLELYLAWSEDEAFSNVLKELISENK